MPMKTEITNLFELPVYTEKAIFVGNVDDVVVDVDQKKIDSLAVGKLNPVIKEVTKGPGLRIPFRIIKSIGDIIIVRDIPGIFRSPAKEE
ncbi:MAG: PRC-barrel domain protein [Euryarchaeota archaeon ADurb.Bin009]|nr:MAG: PRC-barrel domain protein [Euryarchaeota archaeon ADurb.Bin009]